MTMYAFYRRIRGYASDFYNSRYVGYIEKDCSWVHMFVKADLTLRRYTVSWVIINTQYTNLTI